MVVTFVLPSRLLLLVAVAVFLSAVSALCGAGALHRHRDPDKAYGVSCRLYSLGQAQHHSQAAKLRVIVGRGNNSSGGEASLPRVVESHLLQRNMNYISGQGVITVYLRGLRH